MFVLTMDQRGSQRASDLVPTLLAALSDIPARLGFERSVGDEVQGLLETPDAVVEVVMRALRSGDWYVGIGIGPVVLPLPDNPRAAGGPAFVAARRAVDRAKKTGDRVPLSVQAAKPAAEAAEAAEAVLCLIGRLVRARSTAEWRVLDQMQPGVRGQQRAVAHHLGITPQAVSKAVLRSGWQEEQAGRHAAAVLLALAATTAG
ncbi:hypothetical protein IV498_04650 [Paenarthrobacter sp. Z7-10]|uniref:hypothetical protein n=1 Tax=Paenarthrobacter sp. Z7-10 TaxID=2787635 RepID=UPI0022A937C7|nr:hypothetical protein [Paenarthrobacter sp. Z7-10]MCZ2402487.1 hypothetical protein [Paenarthrobacter sp. Z7-10]